MVVIVVVVVIPEMELVLYEYHKLIFFQKG